MSDKKPSPWVEHIKATAKKEGISYSAALKTGKAKESYKAAPKAEKAPKAPKAEKAPKAPKAKIKAAEAPM